MKKLLRRFPRAIRIGVTWGFMWFAAGIILMLVVLLLTGNTGADVPYPVGFGLLGFLAGVTFSGVIALGEGHCRFDEMSLPRFATWGGVGGLSFSVLFVFAVATFGEGAAFIENLVFLGPLFAVIGAGCASILLILARKTQNSELLDGGSEVAEVRG